MKRIPHSYYLPLLLIISAACSNSVSKKEKEKYAQQGPVNVETKIGPLTLPSPFSTESVRNTSKILDWPENQTPVAPEGFTVTKFADKLDNPRISYLAPNNDIFVVESNTKSSADRITLFQDLNKDGTYEVREVFKENLNQPYGMLVLGNYFYIANTDGLYRFPYTAGAKKLEGEGEKIVELPAGGYNNHWTRNLIANKDGSKLYISVGSASNVGEYGMDEEVRRAGILEVNPDGSGEIIYADGLRNPVGMDWNPVTGELWTAVNERDELGDDLVPDYITSVKKGGFYGWPYAYFGQIEDPRMKGERPDLVQKSIVPDVPVGNHTASLGLTFYTHDAFPEKYREGAFIGQHGSWNKKEISGYKVLFVPFKNGKPSGVPEDFLTGFIADRDNAEVWGRPVGVTVLADGSLLVNDDSGNTLWRITSNPHAEEETATN